MTWIALLFAVLAIGVQYSNVKARERQCKCRLYRKFHSIANVLSQKAKPRVVSCALDALHLDNYLVQPTFLCVQALLLISYVLQNDLKPQAAWALLGTTVRIAQSLGLHKIRDEQAVEALLWFVFTEAWYERPIF